VIIGELFPETCVVLPASSAGRSPSSLSPAWQSLPVAGLPPAFLAGAGYGVRHRLFLGRTLGVAASAASSRRHDGRSAKVVIVQESAGSV
jgi:hypothetical protein